MIFLDEISYGKRVSGDGKTSHVSVGSFFMGDRYMIVWMLHNTLDNGGDTERYG